MANREVMAWQIIELCINNILAEIGSQDIKIDGIRPFYPQWKSETLKLYTQRTCY